MTDRDLGYGSPEGHLSPIAFEFGQLAILETDPEGLIPDNERIHRIPRMFVDTAKRLVRDLPTGVNSRTQESFVTRYPELTNLQLGQYEVLYRTLPIIASAITPPEFVRAVRVYMYELDVQEGNR